MPIFKPKASKQLVVPANSTVTLDSKHSSMCDGFASDKIEIRKLAHRRRKLKRAIETTPDLSVRLAITDQIDKLTSTIRLLKEKEKRYYLENCKYVFDYFEEKKNISTQAECDDTSKAATEGNRRIASFFKIKEATATPPLPLLKEAVTVFQKFYDVDESFIDVGNFVILTDVCPKCHQRVSQ